MTANDEEEEKRLRTVSLQNSQAILLARQRAERELTAERERLRITLASIGDAVISVDAEGRVTYLNAVAETLTGWTNADAAGRPLPDVFHIVNERTRRPVENPALRALREGVVVGLANHTVLVARDGVERPIDDSAAPMRDERGKPVGAVLVFRDVTERRRAEEALARLAAIVESSDDAIVSKTLDGVIRSWNAGAERIFGYTAGQAIGQPITLIIPPDLHGEEPAILARIRRGERVEHYETVRVTKDGRRLDISLTISPLRDAEGQVIGASKVARDITDQKRTTEARRRSEQELSDFFENASVGLHWVGPDGTILRVNWAELDLLGYAREEYVGRHIAEFHADRPVIDDILRRLSTGETLQNYEARMVCKDGSVRDVLIASSVLWEEGRFIHTRCFTRDVTEQKRAEAKLREQEQRTRTILESITDAFCTFDRDWRFSSANRQAEVLLGRSREDLVGRNHWEEYPDTLGTDVERNYRRAVAENVTVRFEFYYPTHDRWYEIHAYPSPDGLSIYFRDVGERKRAEIALRQSEEKLRLLADTIPQLAWMARPDGHIFWYNRRWYEYTGTTPEQMEGWGWQSVHDPMELPKVLERWKASIASGEPFDMVFPLKGNDDRFRSFLTRVNPLRDQEGRVLYWFGTNTDIEDQKRAQEALAQSDERFRQLADAMPQIVWTARPDGNIDYLNRRWQEFTGLSESSGNEVWGHILHPDDARPASERWAASLRTGAPFEMEVRLLERHTRTYRWHLIRTVAAHGGKGTVARWYGTSTDIHEQKRAEESSRYLAEASAALASVVDYESTLQKVVNLAVPYFADWAAVDVANDDESLRRLAVAHQDPKKIQLAHELMRQYPPDPHAPSGVFAVLRTGKPEIVSEITDEILVQGAKDEEHLRLIRSLGLKSYICVPLVVSGNAFGALTYATAESGRRYTDADLALATDLAHRAAVAVENTQLYQALREADRRKDEFLATLAHELRNPLAPIRNALQILKMPRVDAGTVERSRDMMERQVHHLVRMVDDLLDVSRVMRGKIDLRRERVELATVVARAVETVQPLVDAQGHQLSIRLPSESLPIDADPVRLTQVVGNLLTNAAKYSEPGERIWLTAERDGDTAVLRIRDTGIGIAPAMVPRIFELFVQVDHASTKAQGGLGIGLTLVKNLVEMHNGTVEARSDGLGKGSEFVVRLPALAERLDKEHGGEAGHPVRETPSPSGYRLLVVDDNQDAANSLAMLLELQGHEVRVAYSGMAALEMTKSYTPDVVFMDIGMPGMDGYDAARRMREQPGLDKIVLAALTGWGQKEDRRRTAEAGFDHHLVKPPEPKAVENVLAELQQRGSTSP